MQPNKLKFYENFIDILCDRNDTATQQLASTIPYIHFNRIKTHYRTTIRNIDTVLKIMRSVDAYKLDELPSFIRELYDKEMHRRIDTKSLIDLGPTQDAGWRFKHQQLGLELSKVNDRFGFFYDTRTGKTPMSLSIINDDIQRYPSHRWLILCPLILIEEAWLADAHHFFPKLSVVSLHGKSKEERHKKFKVNANLYIQNIESFITWQHEIEKLGIHGCFVDESSTMKSTTSKFGKAAVEFAQTMKKWYLLSGTPAPNGEHEYYRQLQSIDLYGVHKSYAQFKDHFFNNISYNPQFEKLQIREDRKQEFVDLVKDYSLYVDKEDVLTTPGREFIKVEMDMPKELNDKYKELARKLYIELDEDTTITASSAAAKMNKLNQVTSGFIIDTEEQSTHLLSRYRFEELLKLIVQHPNEQILIWANYKEEFKQIQTLLGKSCAIVNGTVNIDEKRKNIKYFKEGKIQYLVANPASADKGLTLTNAHICIYFSMNHSYELFKQSMERIYGDIIKQPTKCLYYVMLANNSIDQAIYTAVQNKGDVSAAVLSHLKGRI